MAQWVADFCLATDKWYYSHVFCLTGNNMPQISRSALVPFSAEQMYQLVNDVSSYPEFLPGCVGSRVIAASPNEMTAAVEVAKAGISKTFTTRNTLLDNQRINMQLVDGPFRKLMGGWQFTALSPEACKVELHLDFEFTNKLVELAFGKVFKELTGSMVQAFTQRAKEVYRV
ncbi:ubiquinone-binding protein [Serratia sp. S1B]|nr:ubiquinone-binding protein [Serratia sp. S1B]